MGKSNKENTSVLVKCDKDDITQYDNVSVKFWIHIMAIGVLEVVNLRVRFKLLCHYF